MNKNGNWKKTIAALLAAALLGLPAGAMPVLAQGEPAATAETATAENALPAALAGAQPDGQADPAGAELDKNGVLTVMDSTTPAKGTGWDWTGGFLMLEAACTARQIVFTGDVDSAAIILNGDVTLAADGETSDGPMTCAILAAATDVTLYTGGQTLTLGSGTQGSICIGDAEQAANFYFYGGTLAAAGAIRASGVVDIRGNMTATSANGTTLTGESITLKENATVTAICTGATGAAMSVAPGFDSDTMRVIASTNADGSSPVAYNPADIAAYKYLKIEQNIVTTFAGLKAALESTGTAPIRASGNIELTEPIKMPVDHTLEIARGTELTLTGTDTAKSVIEFTSKETELYRALTITGGGALTVGGAARLQGDTVILDGVTVHLQGGTTLRDGSTKMKLTYLNVNAGAILNLTGAARDGLVVLTGGNNEIRVNEGGAVTVETSDGIGISGGIFRIQAGGTVTIANTGGTGVATAGDVIINGTLQFKTGAAAACGLNMGGKGFLKDGGSIAAASANDSIRLAAGNSLFDSMASLFSDRGKASPGSGVTVSGKNGDPAQDKALTPGLYRYNPTTKKFTKNGPDSAVEEDGVVTVNNPGITKGEKWTQEDDELILEDGFTAKQLVVNESYTGNLTLVAKGNVTLDATGLQGAAIQCNHGTITIDAAAGSYRYILNGGRTGDAIDATGNVVIDANVDANGTIYTGGDIDLVSGMTNITQPMEGKHGVEAAFTVTVGADGMLNAQAQGSPAIQTGQDLFVEGTVNAATEKQGEYALVAAKTLSVLGTVNLNEDTDNKYMYKANRTEVGEGSNLRFGYQPGFAVTGQSTNTITEGTKVALTGVNFSGITKAELLHGQDVWPAMLDRVKAESMETRIPTGFYISRDGIVYTYDAANAVSTFNAPGPVSLDLRLTSPAGVVCLTDALRYTPTAPTVSPSPAPGDTAPTAAPDAHGDIGPARANGTWGQPESPTATPAPAPTAARIPQTSDNMQPLLWVALAAIALCALAFILWRKNKK